MNNSNVIYGMMAIINSAMVYLKLIRVDSNNFHHKGKSVAM